MSALTTKGLSFHDGRFVRVFADPDGAGRSLVVRTGLDTPCLSFALSPDEAAHLAALLVTSLALSPRGEEFIEAPTPDLLPPSGLEQLHKAITRLLDHRRAAVEAGERVLRDELKVTGAEEPVLLSDLDQMVDRESEGVDDKGVGGSGHDGASTDGDAGGGLDPSLSRARRAYLVSRP